MKAIAIIPARFASTRFPGKPLALLGGKPMIEWVWNTVSQMDALDDAIVATDDQRIADAVHAFGGHAVMTSSSHRSGTDRCGEVINVLKRQGKEYDVVINVQGDEPFTRPEQLQKLIDCFEHRDVQIATLKKRITTDEELFSPNNVKVICDASGNAIYFSRQPLPYLRGTDPKDWLTQTSYYKHVGIYAFRSDTLEKLVTLPQTQLELCESLEQLRWIENGYHIRVSETDASNIGIDTPEDLDAAAIYIKERSIQ